jgi:preprotein translocase subunit SecD
MSFERRIGGIAGRCPLATALVLLLVFAGCSTAQSIQSAPPSTGPIIQLRLAHDTPGEQLERFDFAGRSVYLERAAIITDADLISVRPSIAASGLALELHYTPEAGSRMAAAVAANIGGYIALLIDSRVRNVARIVSPIESGGRVVAATDATGIEAEEIAERVRAKWRIQR